MKGKIKPNGIVEQATGATFTKNDPAKFGSAGRGGTVKTNGIVDQASGPTFTANKTHAPTVHPSTTPKATKVMKTSAGEDPHMAACAKNASDVGTSGGQPHGYLKASYGK